MDKIIARILHAPRHPDMREGRVVVGLFGFYAKKARAGGSGPGVAFAGNRKFCHPIAIFPEGHAHGIQVNFNKLPFSRSLVGQIGKIEWLAGRVGVEFNLINRCDCAPVKPQFIESGGVEDEVFLSVSKLIYIGAVLKVNKYVVRIATEHRLINNGDGPFVVVPGNVDCQARVSVVIDVGVIGNAHRPPTPFPTETRMNLGCSRQRLGTGLRLR